MIDPKIIEEYNKINWQKLLRKDLGEYSLEESKINLDNIKTIFDDILGYPNIDSLSPSFTNQLRSQLISFNQFQNQIISTFKDTGQKQTWINNIKNKDYEVFNSLAPIYNYIQTFDPSKDGKLKELVKSTEAKINEVNKELAKAEGLLKKAQENATESEVNEYGNFFGLEAKQNKINWNLNLGLMIFSIILTITLAILFLQEVTFVKTDWEWFWTNLLDTINTQNILIKFVALSLGWYLITHFSKVYSAEKHLYNVNSQRQNALNSHKQILNSVISTDSDNEKEIRNAILLELTRSMFDKWDTGYLKWWQQQNPTNQIIEISKTLSK